MKQLNNEEIYNILSQMDQSMTPVHMDVYVAATQRVHTGCLHTNSTDGTYIVYSENNNPVSVFKYIDSSKSQFGTIWASDEVMNAVDDIEYEMI